LNYPYGLNQLFAQVGQPTQMQQQHPVTRQPNPTVSGRKMDKPTQIVIRREVD
jgi:hypothetical protein